MPAYVNANNAYSTLAGNIAVGDTSFTLANGSAFPAVAAGDWSFVTFQDTANHIEIMKITAHGSGANSFSCLRGQEGTIPRAWITGDVVECRFTAGTVATVDGVQTLTNKTLVTPNLKFADGTLAAPGIAWNAEPATGFARIGANDQAVVVNGVAVMHWQPAASFFNTPAYLLNGSSINFGNTGNANLWEAIHANLNTLHLGRGGWTNTYIYGGGAANINVHAGGVAFSGAITGISAASVGLGNVANIRQIGLRGGAGAISIGWAGALDVQVDSTYYGTTWPINITGNATSCSGNAASASNAAAVDGISGWAYANHASNPVYIWCSDGSPAAQFLTQPGYLSVNYANSAGYAGSAGNGLTPIHAGGTAGGAGDNALDGGFHSILRGLTVDGYGRVTAMTAFEPGGGSSIHPDSEIVMADGSTKWLRDLRLGDSVKGATGPAAVLGMWTTVLQERPLWEVVTAEGAVVCTPGHLFPVRVDGVEGWGAPVPQSYWKYSHGRRRTIKGKTGLIDTLSLLVDDADTVYPVVAGTELFSASGQWIPVTSVREVPSALPPYDATTKRSVGTHVTENQQVIALLLAGSKVFYADGHAVGTLA